MIQWCNDTIIQLVNYQFNNFRHQEPSTKYQEPRTKYPVPSTQSQEPYINNLTIQQRNDVVMKRLSKQYVILEVY